MKIEELGEFGFIDHITRRQKENINSSTIIGIGDDGAVVEHNSDQQIVVSSDLMLEGIHFDLAYTPLKHLGYKSVVVAASDICAMGGEPRQLLISLGITSGFSVEMIDEYYEGVDVALKEYGIDLIGGDTSASISGLTISLTAMGSVAKGEAIKRCGAAVGDIICVTGDLGSSFMGQKLLEREKNVNDSKERAVEYFQNYSYLIERALKPILRNNLNSLLAKNGVKATSMIDLTDGMASELLHLCKKSNVGCKIYIDRLPISDKSFEAGDELGIDPVIATMNGGDDHEIMFTLPATDHEKIEELEGITIVGYITKKEEGHKLLTAQGNEISIKAQGHKE